MKLEKYGKYKWEFIKGEEHQYDCYFRLDKELVGMSEQGYLDLELRNVDYDEEVNGKLVNPRYYLEIWCDDANWVYSTNNLNNCRGVMNKFAKKITSLIDQDNLNWKTLNRIGIEFDKDDEKRKAKEDRAIMGKRVTKWAKSMGLGGGK
jgi:hypothetical protein|tara:strand:+ start:49 stop:495 length:447 start_codon:yes stop_codon:yes gene_type:complete